MRLLLLLFVVLLLDLPMTQSLSLGSFFNGLLGFSDEQPLVSAPLGMNDTEILNNNNATAPPNEYEYQDIETITTTISGEVISTTLEPIEETITEASVTIPESSTIVEETTTPEMELGDFVNINQGDSIVEGSG